MIKYEVNIDISIFPQSVRVYLENSKIYDSSCSNIKVYYSDDGYYVKIAEKGRLSHEAEISKRFYGLGIGVEVLEFVSTDKDYLVTREAKGTDLTHCTDDPELICRILADALKMLHGTPCDDVVLSPAQSEYLAIANAEPKKDAVKQTPVTELFGITDINKALGIIKKNVLKLTADTLIHGDACLPNVIQNNGAFSAFIDFAMSGKGDKHIDLYWAIWSLWFNLKTTEYTDLFLDLYGRESFDFEMIRTVAAIEAIA